MVECNSTAYNMYIYIHVRMYYIYIRAFIYVYIYVRMYYIYMYVRVYLYIYIRVYIYVCVCFRSFWWILIRSYKIMCDFSKRVISRCDNMCVSLIKVPMGKIRGNYLGPVRVNLEQMPMAP